VTVALITKGRVCQPEIVLQFSANINAELSNCELPCNGCNDPIIKVGNSIELLFLVTADGVRLTEAQLLAADDVIFSVKDDPLDENIDSLILKNFVNGLIILPDGTDTSPNVQVSLSSTDTMLNQGSYPSALQVDFAIDDCKEADLSIGTVCFNEIYFEQDVIRC